MVNWLIRRAQRTPYFHLTAYMNRWWLVPYREPVERQPGVFDNTGPVSWDRPVAWLLQRFDIAVRIHQILRSDNTRHPHDHPWPYMTVVLKNGYTEVRFDSSGNEIGRKWHGPGSIMFRPANSWHLLVLPKGQDAWTLFITFRKKQTWGFNVDGQKIKWTEYLKENQ
jgi:hypothetical protein